MASFGDFIEDRFVLAVARSHIKRLHAAGSASRRRKCSESQLKVSASNTSRKSILLMLLSARLIMSLAPVEAGEYYRDKTVRIVVGFAPGGSRPHGDLANVPLARVLAKSDDGRLLLKVAAENPNLLTTAYAMPPGSKGEHVAILRKAFRATLQDRAFWTMQKSPAWKSIR